MLALYAVSCLFLLNKQERKYSIHVKPWHECYWVNLEKTSRLRREQDNVGEIIVCCVLCLLHCLGSTKALLGFLVVFFRKNVIRRVLCTWVYELDNRNTVDVKATSTTSKLAGKLEGNYNFSLENLFEIKRTPPRYL